MRELYRRLTSERRAMPRLYFAILSFFLFLVLFVFILGMGVYNATLRASKAEFEHRVAAGLSTIWERTDSEILTMYETGRNLLENFYVQEHLRPYTQTNDEQRLVLFKVSKVINESKRLLSSTDEIFLYLDDHKVYTSDGIADFSSYFSSIYCFENIPAEFWASQREQTAKLTVLSPVQVYRRYSGTNRRVVPIVTREYVNGWRTVTVISLDIEKLCRPLERGMLYPSSRFAVLTSRNELAFSNMEQEQLQEISPLLTEETGTADYATISGERYFVVSAVGLSGWRILLATPEEEFRRVNDDLLHLIFLICAVLILFGVVLSFVFAYLLYSPLRNIRYAVLNASRTESQSASLAQVEREVTDLVQHYQFLRDSRQNEAYFAMQAYLLYGLYGERPQQFLELLAGGRFSHSSYAVAALCVQFKSVFRDQPEVTQEVMLQSIEILVEKCIPYPLFFIEFGNHMRAAVVNLPKGDIGAVLDGLDTISHILEHDKMYLRCFFGVSSESDEVNDLQRLFDQARTAMEYVERIGGQDIVCASQLRIRHAYFYPFAQEQQLLQYLKAADMKNLQRLTTELLNQNLETPVLWRSIRSLIQAMLGTAQSYFSDEAASLPDFEYVFYSPSMCYHMLIDQYQRMITRMGDAQDTSNIAIDYIRKYIEEHYADNLSLTELAERAGYNAKYISRLFKQYIGYHLSDYINYVRIQKAKEFLRDPSLSIAKIQELVGIPSYTTFTRVFKKFEGIPPSHYRQLEQITRSEGAVELDWEDTKEDRSK